MKNRNKVKETESKKHNGKKKVIIISVCAALLVALLTVVTVGLVLYFNSPTYTATKLYKAVRDKDGEALAQLILPSEREMTVKFRDLIHPDITVTLSNKPCVIELSDIVPMKNESREELKNALLTRVQGSNVEKNRCFGKRLPAFVKDAVSEIENLVYT